MSLVGQLDDSKFEFIWLVCESDSQSVNQLRNAFGDELDENLIFKVRRPREVGQSYVSSVFTTLLSFWFLIF